MSLARLRRRLSTRATRQPGLARLTALGLGRSLAALGIVALLAPGPATLEVTAPIDGVHGEGSVEVLLEEHDCWTGAAPADMEGKLPGHVVITRIGTSTPVYAGTVGVGRALEQVFTGADHGLAVHGFCR